MSSEQKLGRNAISYAAMIKRVLFISERVRAGKRAAFILKEVNKRADTEGWGTISLRQLKRDYMRMKKLKQPKPADPKGWRKVVTPLDTQHRNATMALADLDMVIDEKKAEYKKRGQQKKSIDDLIKFYRLKARYMKMMYRLEDSIFVRKDLEVPAETDRKKTEFSF